jgi:two-component system chemotaxis sensor kinase CheA
MAQDPYKYFRVEAHELLEQLGKTTLDLERGPSPELVARLLRLAHTLKGAARVVKQREIADRAHALEEVLAPFRAPSGPIPREPIEAVLALVDDMGRRVAALDAAPEPAPNITARAAPDVTRTVHADVAELDDLLDGVLELQAQVAVGRRAMTLLERGKRLAELLAAEVLAPTSAERLRGGHERAISMAAELGSLLVRHERELAASLDHIDRELGQVRHTAEELRLVPASAIFTSLERTARDAAQALGRRVTFEARGGAVRLDAQVLQTVQAALVQLVRNSVAHGIEPEERRRAAGKPPAGRVTIDVLRRGRLVAFVSEDDGAGVDLEAVRRALQRKGLLSAEARELGTEALLRLLLAGGVTTSAAVTEVSGRGIGLDLVRETTQRLGGEVTVRTTGQGTIVELVVPVSVASVGALSVEASGTKAAIPLDAIERTMQVAAGDVVRTAEGESVVHDGKVLPFLSLWRALSSRQAAPRGARPWSAVVVRGGGGLAILGVDRLLGTSNVVVRPLPELAPASAIVMGAALDAEGNPRLVLDPDALVLLAGQERPSEREPEVLRPPILVVDDSLTTRMLERSILESAGYEVDVAVSGEEALVRARGRSYGLFLVDIEMPGMDGFTFVERTRADVALMHVPAILVSSRNSPEDRLRGEAVGALAYVVKSEFDQGDLLALIRARVG